MQKITTPEALKMLSDAFEEPVANLRPEVARDDVPGWDSMGALTLMAELDERFGIELTADESKKMSRIDDVLQLLRQHGALAD
jgi:acyl carrier protein